MKYTLLFALSSVALSAAHLPESRLARLPLVFEHSSAPGHFVSHTIGLTFDVTATAATFGERSMRLIGANPKARGTLEGRLAGQSHYFLGNDPRRWRTHVPQYARLRFRNLYPGIDVVYYGIRGETEFDFVLAPGADPRRIHLEIDPGLDLRAPHVYQGDRVIESKLERHGRSLTFALGSYDRARALTIDPVISYATLIGGGGNDSGSAIATDASGAIYLTGTTTSVNFPVINGVQSRLLGQDAFVAKLDSSGTTLLYSTYLGGTPLQLGTGTENGLGIAVDAAGSAYVAGNTTSADFPTLNPAQSTYGGSTDGFVSKLSPDGSALVYSTYIGGSSFDGAGMIAVDAGGSAYVAGFTASNNFPVRSAFQSALGGGQDAFATKLDAKGAAVYSTYLGGSGTEFPNAIAVDVAGNAYLAGSTSSLNFPLKNPLQAGSAGQNDAFITKLSADGTALVYSTYLGGTLSDSALGIAVDSGGNTYLAGTTSSRDFPTNGALQRSLLASALFKSTDAGSTFTPSDQGLPGQPTFLAVDPLNTSNLYALVAGMLFNSTNAGATWKSLQSTFPSGVFVSSFALDPASPSTLYAGGPAGTVFKSADAGATWKAVQSGGAFPSTLAVDPRNSSIVYLGSAGGNALDGLYKSTDGGETWHVTGLGGRATAVKAFAIDPSNPSTLYANSGNMLQKSTDGGEIWRPLVTTFYPSFFLVDPANSAILYAHNFTNVYKSTDGGATWRDTGLGAPVSGLAIDPKNTAILYASAGNGIYKTTDRAGSWQRTATVGTSQGVLAIDPGNTATLYVASPIFSDAFVAKLNPQGSALLYSTFLGGAGSDGANAIAVDALGNAFVAGFTGSLDFPLRNAVRSEKLPASEGFIAQLNPVGAELVYSSFLGTDPIFRGGLAAGVDGSLYVAGTSSRTDFPSGSPLQDNRTRGIFRSEDGAGSWTGETLPGSVARLAVDPRNSSRVFAISSGFVLFRSLDGGRTWSRLTGLPSARGIAIDPVNPANIYAANFGGGLYKSTDGGDTWRNVRFASNLANQFQVNQLNSVVVDPRTPASLYAATNDGVYTSADAGETWARTTGRTSAPSAPALFLAIDAQSTLYAVIAFSIQKSTDRGATWVLVADGLPVSEIYADSGTPSTQYWRGGGGLFKSFDGGAQFANIYSGGGSTLAIDPSAREACTVSSHAWTRPLRTAFIRMITASSSAPWNFV